MSKRARRLWLGDWERESPAREDTFVITPEEAPDGAPTKRSRDRRRGLAALAAVALVVLLAVALSSSGNEEPLVSQQEQQPLRTQIPQPQPQPPQGAPQQGFGGADLTGADAAKAAQAAVAKYPGDIERVTRGPTGAGYVVHVIQPDGNEVHVVLDDQFNVQGSDADSGPRGFGSGTSQ